MRKIVCLGDSLTYGYGVKTGSSWVDILSRKHKEYSFINQGQCGDTTLDMKSRLLRDVFAYNPDGLILLGGVNDILCGYVIDLIIENVSSILWDCRRRGIACLLLLPLMISLKPGPLAWVGKSQYRELNNSIRNLRIKLQDFAAGNDFPYLDLLSVYLTGEDRDDFFLPDGIHIGEEIHGRIAKKLEMYGLQKITGIINN